ncbi:hypothetical protein DPU22_21850 [Salmonella enterica subsp. enterica serovar Newport]|uniref:Uncharacterized protein n=1 Tax=Salmonella enterica I TaxID=59201 RepID=A0A3V2NZI6_SALET|nr:hypothetical protein LFZ28_24985 [Salmonella enterica subsp. enterica serovar Milwaukee str. SA19950795]EAA7255324.1 hypothetical protein [Salmonella enterica subsp. enterica serovar Newport]EAU2346099.1 hypothetical protein [Salmonella enterica]EBZ2217198.1 hypothetical protein [Salmonella enterica subsp. enterica serovar Montevideo]ECE8818534.1 hypothetical protein [Salmonella enterica subsp. enterica serovar Reading]ECI2685316.1 hypothetical protein [Salmonella enterica subsp. enterica]
MPRDSSVGCRVAIIPDTGALKGQSAATVKPSIFTHYIQVIDIVKFLTLISYRAKRRTSEVYA